MKISYKNAFVSCGRRKDFARGCVDSVSVLAPDSVVKYKKEEKRTEKK